MSDYSELKMIAEACQQHQPLRFMPSHGALYIRNDNGIVFDVHQNRSFPEFMAQNKDYADLVLAANPAAVLALIAENERLERKNANQSESIREYQDLVMGGDVSLGMLKADIRVTTGERDELRAEVAGLKTGYQAYEQVNAELKAEVGALRQIISDSATSCGAAVSVECTLDFMKHLPVEIFSVISKLRNALAECADSLHGEMLQKFGGQLPDDMHPVTRREYDRDMAEVAGCRVALGRGEQS